MKILIASLLVIAAASIPKSHKKDPTEVVDEGLALTVSQESVEMIIYYEVGGRSYYNSKLTSPTVPAWRTTSSGVTVGFGFDVGYNSPKEIENAFKGILSKREIEALQSVSGLKGRSAYYNGLPKVKHIVHVSYEDAEKVFKRDSLPRFTEITANSFKISKDRLHPHSNGALTSLVFNRGGSMSSSSSRNEMRYIRSDIAAGKEHKVPDHIRAMKRLWSYTRLKGLHLRRDAEAEMFQKGIDTKKQYD